MSSGTGTGRTLDLGGAPAAGLLRRNRLERPTTPPAAPEQAEAAEQRPALAAVPAIAPDSPSPVVSEAPAAAEQRKPRTPRPSATSTRQPASTADAKEPTERVGGYLPRSVRARAVAAHKATQYMEGESNWTEFITAAIVRETERREQQYNDGAPFEDRSGGKLKTGRPLRG